MVVTAALVTLTRARHGVSGTELVVQTPFGPVHTSCILHLGSGATVAESHDSTTVEIRHSNGSITSLPRCTSAPAANYTTYVDRRGGAAGRSPISVGANPATWNGWPFHIWFGGAYAHFTTPALVGDIVTFATTWTVPPRPANTRGNNSDPWGHHPPTLSTWIGVQGGAVLQPVLEWSEYTFWRGAELHNLLLRSCICPLAQMACWRAHMTFHRGTAALLATSVRAGHMVSDAHMVKRWHPA